LGLAWGIDMIVSGVAEKHPALLAPTFTTSAHPSGFVVRF